VAKFPEVEKSSVPVKRRWKKQGKRVGSGKEESSLTHLKSLTVLNVFLRGKSKIRAVQTASLASPLPL
jgi:hypothetical protein